MGGARQGTRALDYCSAPGRKELGLFEVQQTGALKYPYFGPGIIRRL
jgi:16S rRNA C967 or C1407 C5-methylase (RsmB/RsmF family)